jgi:hypothetical protein
MSCVSEYAEELVISGTIQNDMDTIASYFFVKANVVHFSAHASRSAVLRSRQRRLKEELTEVTWHPDPINFGSPGTAVMGPTMSWNQRAFLCDDSGIDEVGEESRWTTSFRCR